MTFLFYTLLLLVHHDAGWWWWVAGMSCLAIDAINLYSTRRGKGGYGS